MPQSIFAPGSAGESSRIAAWLRRERTGGFLLIAAASLGIALANLTDGYAHVRDFEFGPSGLHLSVGDWTADGLLAIFFFVVGLELKREFVAGDLRDPRRALLPILAAVGGMVAPALIYLALAPAEHREGWAIPTATDIAFAVAVLSVLGTHLPVALRTFLLTLAIVDDLLAIIVIAIFYATDVSVLWLLGSLAVIAVFGLLVQRHVRSAWLLVPLALTAWACMHTSGIHATIAGVLLAFTVPVGAGGSQSTGYTAYLEHLVRPLSSGLAVPLFAFFAVGVTLDGLGSALTDRLTLAVAVALLAGKTIGVFSTTWLLATLTHAELDDGLSWRDVLGLSMLAGIGFTVSLLIGKLAIDGPAADQVTIGVLAGSILSALGAAVVLRRRAG